MPQGPPVVITELADGRYRSISTSTDARHMLVGSEIVARLLAQLSENPELLGLYEDLLGVGGPDLVLNSASEHIVRGGQASFAQVSAAAVKRGEIAIGYRLDSQSSDRDANFGVRINPSKAPSLVLGENDAVIVVSCGDD